MIVFFNKLCQIGTKLNVFLLQILEVFLDGVTTFSWLDSNRLLITIYCQNCLSLTSCFVDSLVE
jgi:hypothetical protein